MSNHVPGDCSGALAFCVFKPLVTKSSMRCAVIVICACALCCHKRLLLCPPSTDPRCRSTLCVILRAIMLLRSTGFPFKECRCRAAFHRHVRPERNCCVLPCNVQATGFRFQPQKNCCVLDCTVKATAFTCTKVMCKLLRILDDGGHCSRGPGMTCDRCLQRKPTGWPEAYLLHCRILFSELIRWEYRAYTIRCRFLSE